MTITMKPNILKYIEYSSYLRDFYSWAKLENSTFSYQNWAAEAGLASKGYLRMVVIGKRKLTQETMCKILPTLGLDLNGVELFKVLVELDQSKTLEAKTTAYEKILKIKSFNKVSEIENDYDYLSNPCLPRLHVILGVKGISKIEKDISKYLGQSLAEVRKMLNRLEDLNLAKNENGNWSSKDQITLVSNKVNNIGVQHFHKNSLETSIEAINLDSTERHFNAIYCTLDRKSYVDVTKRIEAFTRELLLDYSNKEMITDKKLYQINTNLIPMSENLIRLDNERAIELTQN